VLRGALYACELHRNTKEMLPFAGLGFRLRDYTPCILLYFGTTSNSTTHSEHSHAGARDRSAQ
jgi:hypothetical protein